MRDFKAKGEQSALPIWAEFMKRAHQHREYRNVHSFQPPDGIVTAEIDGETGELATPNCPKVRTEVFIAGSQPVQICHIHGNGRRIQVTSWEPTQEAAPIVLGSSAPSLESAAAQIPAVGRSIPVTPLPPAPKLEKKRSIWDRLFGK